MLCYKGREGSALRTACHLERFLKHLDIFGCMSRTMKVRFGRNAMSGRHIPTLLALVMLLGAPLAAEAQRPRVPQPEQEQSRREQRNERAQDRDSVRIPRQYMPPPGMCRIWLDGVPPERQPAPTDCPTAIRKRPSNGRVVFGERKTSGDSSAPELRRNLRGNTPPVRVRIPPILR